MKFGSETIINCRLTDALKYFEDFAKLPWSQAAMEPIADASQTDIDEVMAKEAKTRYEVSKGSARGEFVVVEVDPDGERTAGTYRLSADPKGTKIAFESDIDIDAAIDAQLASESAEPPAGTPSDASDLELLLGQSLGDFRDAWGREVIGEILSQVMTPALHGSHRQWCREFGAFVAAQKQVDAKETSGLL